MNKRYLGMIILVFALAILSVSFADQKESNHKHLSERPYEIVHELVSIWSLPFMPSTAPLPEELQAFADVFDQVRSIGKSQYAGAYLHPESGKLHLNLLEALSGSAVRIENPDVIVHYVKYSLAQLEAAEKATNINSAKLKEVHGFWFAQVDVAHNRLVVAVLEDAKGIETGLAELGIDPDMYAVYIHDGSFLLI